MRSGFRTQPARLAVRSSLRLQPARAAAAGGALERKPPAWRGRRNAGGKGSGRAARYAGAHRIPPRGPRSRIASG